MKIIQKGKLCALCGITTEINGKKTNNKHKDHSEMLLKIIKHATRFMTKDEICKYLYIRVEDKERNITTRELEAILNGALNGKLKLV
jgi:diphthamide biosynthesis methyltransferase